MVLFKEVYFSNSEDEIKKITVLLESNSIPYSVNKSDEEDLNGKENYKYSISVEENKINEVLEIIKSSENERLLSEEKNFDIKIEASNHNLKKMTFAYIIPIIITFALIGTINVSKKIYSEYQNKKKIASLYNEKTSIQTESSADKKNELIKKTSYTIEEYYEYRKLTEETHGINVFGSADEIALPKNIQVQGIRNMCYDDDYRLNGEIITDTNIFYKNGICEVKISKEDYIKYKPFKVTAASAGKVYEFSCYDPEGFEDYNLEYGTTYSFQLMHHDYAKDVVPYSVCLVSKETNTCIIEKLIEVVPDESILIFNETFDVHNLFESGWKSINVGEKYKLYFPKYSGNNKIEDKTVFDSIIFSKRLYVDHGGYIYNIPFVTYLAKKSFERMNVIEFSMNEKIEFHLDLYSSSDDLIDYISCLDNFESKCPYGTDSSKKITIPAGTIWTVNTTDGLNVRTRPYGNRIAGILDKTKLIQSESISLAYDDIIDGVYGFWIPVKIDDNDLIRKFDDFDYYDCALYEYPKISGWVFTGYCKEK